MGAQETNLVEEDRYTNLRIGRFGDESSSDTKGFYVSADRHIALSIIVPCYKVEQYLPACLDSLVSQTLPNIEIICINDGSPDRCINILRDYEARFPDKVVVVDKRNEGVWRGRWDGIALARGEYIGFLDSDDTAEPRFAELLYETAKSKNADIAVCGFSRIDRETGKVYSKEMVNRRKDFSIENDPGRLIDLNGAPWKKCFRASVLKSLTDLENPPSVLDDLAFHLIAYAEMRGNVAFVADSLVNYMVRSDSIITTIKMTQVDSVLTAFSEIQQRYRVACPELIPILDVIAFLHLGVSLTFRLSNNRSADVDSYIIRVTNYLNEYFPSWKTSTYLHPGYAFAHGSAYVKLLVVHRVYLMGLLPQFLKAYTFMINTFHVDIKW